MMVLIGEGGVKDQISPSASALFSTRVTNNTVTAKRSPRERRSILPFEFVKM